MKKKLQKIIGGSPWEKFRKKKQSAPAGISSTPKKRIAATTEPSRQIRTLSRENVLPYFAGFLLLAASVMVFIVYRSFAWPMFLATLIYVGFENVYKNVLKFFKRKENLSAALCTALVVMIILGPSILIARQLLKEMLTMVKLMRNLTVDESIFELILKFPDVVDIFTDQPFFWLTLSDTIHTYLGETLRYIDPEQISSWLSDAYSVVSGGLSATAFFAMNVILALIMLFFLFRDGSQFYSFLREALPFPVTITDNFIFRMKETVRAVFLGNVLVSILQGTAVGIGLYICNIPNSFIYAFIAGVFSLIPIIGTGIIWLPATIFLIFFRESYGLAAFLSTWCMFFYLMLENVLKPNILDRKLGISPILLFFSILGGLAEFGVTGVILGPLIVTLFVTLWSIYHIWGGEEAFVPVNLPGTATNTVFVAPEDSDEPAKK